MADEKKDRHRFRVAISLPEPLWLRLGKLVGDRNRSEVIRSLVAWYLREPGAKLPERPPRDETAPTEVGQFNCRAAGRSGRRRRAVPLDGPAKGEAVTVKLPSPIEAESAPRIRKGIRARRS